MKNLLTSAMILFGLALIANALNLMIDGSITRALIPLLPGAALLVLAVARIRAPLLMRIENKQYYSY